MTFDIFGFSKYSPMAINNLAKPINVFSNNNFSNSFMPSIFTGFNGVERMNTFMPSFNFPMINFSRLFSGIGSFFGGIGSSAGSFVRGVGKSVGNLVGSVKYAGLINKYSRQYGVDPQLIKEIIRQESGFNPNAKSRCGAMGLMQILNGPLDPEKNISEGCRRISSYISKYHGNVKLALAAYNAGPGNVHKYGGIPPFKETQNYVAKITSRYQKNCA